MNDTNIAFGTIGCSDFQNKNTGHFLHLLYRLIGATRVKMFAD